MNRDELLNTLATDISKREVPHALRVAIDGPTAAGKTVLADELTQYLERRDREVIRATIDGFHRPREHRYKNGESAEAYYEDSFNYPAVRDELLAPLGPDGTGVYKTAVFDFRTDSFVQVDPVEAPNNAILLFDGVMLLRDELDEYWDYRIFVHVDTDTSARRAEKRDIERFGSAEQVRRKYHGRYKPGQRYYVQRARPHLRADAVILNDHPEQPVLLRACDSEMSVD